MPRQRPRPDRRTRDRRTRDRRPSARRVPLALSGAAAGIAALLTATTVAAHGLPGPVSDPQPAATAYVALGDSYSSGLGTRSYLDDGTDCQRSASAFPSQIAAAQGHALNFRACAGAVISDVRSAQLSALSGSTGLVTISVGGNDAGFADVLTECALPAWASDCHGAIDGAQAFIAGQLAAQLTGLYDEIRAAAPAAQVVVVGYPRIFMGEDCNALTWFSPEEQTRLNQTADQLNAVLGQAASGAGFGFADPTAAFIGHAVCDDPEWINGLSTPINESYHPNVDGHVSGYTSVVSGATGTTVTASAAVRRTAAAQAEQLARQQRAYAAVDRTIRPPEFRAPDLDSPRVRAAAQRAGIDLDDRAGIDRADRVAARAQAQQQRR